MKQLKLTLGNGSQIAITPKKKYQFIFPVRDNYIEIDRDFVWTGLARYGFAIQPLILGITSELNSNYDERIVRVGTVSEVCLPNFFDFNLFVNGKVFFSRYINFRSIPTIQHMLELPCGYYLSKGTKIHCDMPFIGSYFSGLVIPPNLSDDDAIDNRSIVLYLDGFEVDEFPRNVIEKLCTPHIYVQGGYFTAVNGVEYPLGPVSGLGSSWIDDIVAATGLPWPRANDNQFSLESQYLHWNKPNDLPIIYNHDCLITKLWKYDFEFVSLNITNVFLPLNFEAFIWDEGFQFNHKPTKLIGNLGVDSNWDLVRMSPMSSWHMGVNSAQECNDLAMYSKWQLKDYNRGVYQRDVDQRDMLLAQSLGLPHSTTKIQPLMRRRYDSDLATLRLNIDEYILHNGLQFGNLITFIGEGIPCFIQSWSTIVKRLIFIGVKEFINKEK